MLAPHIRDAQNERDGAGLRIPVAAATPSQQRLRRSSVAAALRAASAPSQQHRLRRGRDAQNERDGAGLRISSDSVAAPSQQRCAHHERSTGHWAKQPLGKICHLLGKNRGTLPPPSNLPFS